MSELIDYVEIRYMNGEALRISRYELENMLRASDILTMLYDAKEIAKRINRLNI